MLTRNPNYIRGIEQSKNIIDKSHNKVKDKPVTLYHKDFMALTIDEYYDVVVFLLVFHLIKIYKYCQKLNQLLKRKEA